MPHYRVTPSRLRCADCAAGPTLRYPYTSSRAAVACTPAADRDGLVVLRRLPGAERWLALVLACDLGFDTPHRSRSGPDRNGGRHRRSLCIRRMLPAVDPPPAPAPERRPRRSWRFNPIVRNTNVSRILGGLGISSPSPPLSRPRSSPGPYRRLGCLAEFSSTAVLSVVVSLRHSRCGWSFPVGSGWPLTISVPGTEPPSRTHNGGLRRNVA